MILAKIYIIKNKINDTVYIGQTNLSLEDRMKLHIKDSASYDLPMYLDMRKYGASNFYIEDITTCLDQNKLILEKYYINDYYEKGYAVYNLVGLKAPNSHRQRIAELRMNNNFDYHSEEFKKKMSSVTSGEKNGMYGKKGFKAPNGQAVVALDKEGNVKHTFVSVREALKFCGVKGHVQLNKAVRTGEEYKGYYWKKTWKKFA